ncbi:MAG: phospholipase D family protein [Gammaproteobacteria bacterium]
MPIGDDTELDELIAGPEETHPGQSGFRLLDSGLDAFAVRGRSAVLAGRSLDVQTYIWHADASGRFLAHRLLEAADRGVQVRILVDDFDARAKNDKFAALDAHENIEVRIFNPFKSRRGFFGKVFELVGDFGRLNHRMHNKSWIADNRIAVAGGRNLGDEYFNASGNINFVDLDFAMIGPIVRDVSAAFDEYWNSPAVHPVADLESMDVEPAALEQLRSNLAAHAQEASDSEYARRLANDESVQALASGDWPMEWTAEYEFVADDPLKATLGEPGPERSRVLGALTPLIEGAERNAKLISPYFVPGENGTAILTRVADDRDVEILTNSLAATDVAAVHGGYARNREDLLEAGVVLYEMKPQPGEGGGSGFLGSQGTSLHTKALTVDGDTLFVGSYNLDPRSTSLNCEQGILVKNDVLAGQLEAIFDRQRDGARAWRVTLQDGDLSWSDGTKTLDSEPDATMGRRFQAWIARLLRLDAQL